MEAKRSFADASTSGSKDRLELEMDASMLTAFLETCIKMLHDSKVVKGLQELITRCVGTMPREQRIVWKLRKHTMQKRRKMRLTA